MRTTYRIRSPSLQVRVASHARRCAPLNKWSTAPVAKSLFLPSGLWRRDSQRNALTVASGRYDARAERMAALGGNRCGCHALCCSKAELACFAEGRSVVVARRRWADCLRRIAAVAGGGSNWRFSHSGLRTPRKAAVHLVHARLRPRLRTSASASARLRSAYLGVSNVSPLEDHGAWSHAMRPALDITTYCFALRMRSARRRRDSSFAAATAASISSKLIRNSCARCGEIVSPRRSRLLRRMK